MNLLDDKYATSSHHLDLLRLYDLLDFADFPFLKVDFASNGKKFLNYFVAQLDSYEHRLLSEIHPANLFLVEAGILSVREAFNKTESSIVYSCLYDNAEKIIKCFAIPINEFIAANPIPDDYIVELPKENNHTHLTPYHAKYYSYELTKQSSSDSVDKLASAIVDAQVQLNPHQVDAALFAFQSPLSKGVLLADEVGLGKTIEAGLVILQKWAERKRKILIIVPSNLRKQWYQELQEKFFLESVILETKSFNYQIKKLSNLNPFEQKDKIIICSYHFAKSRDTYIKLVNWDLVVMDEAHRLRNVYRPDNKIGNAIKNALSHVDKKLLLTATPLQNTLLELFGLVSLIDENIFGDLNSFKNQYSHVVEGEENFDDLKNRLSTISKRTLRRDVLQYIPYTERHSITEDFYPTEPEADLYEMVSDYLSSPKLYALPASQRQLMTLILRKLLASSTFAISGTLKAFADRLDGLISLNAKANENLEKEIIENYEGYDEAKEEWEEEEEESNEITNIKPKPKNSFTPEELIDVKKELADLRKFQALAEEIRENSKGNKLMIALKKGFEKLQEKANKKAIIFTESTRTQQYLFEILSQTEYAGKIVLFNGTNNDEQSKKIYRDWLDKNKGTDKVTGSATADKRSALVEYFRDEAELMIATEAAAEGINLQFCSLVVNYDLPWNPQRIEQRIGRCHRYGQKYDVVVVNFLNKGNEADQRVYDILKFKFQLFDGVFGASDEVLGAIGSGVDFEKRIAEIYKNYRSPETIQLEFDFLQEQYKTEIDTEVGRARQSLLENFDAEVNEKLKIQSENTLNKYEEWLWSLSAFFLKPYAEIDNANKWFLLKENPFKDLDINEGPYRLAKNVEDANTYRLQHPLAENIIAVCKQMEMEEKELTFHYQGIPKMTVIENLRGQTGWLTGINYNIKTAEEQDYVLLTAQCDDGTLLDIDICRKLFTLPATESAVNYPFEESKKETLSKLKMQLDSLKAEITSEIELKNVGFYKIELDKLERWSADKRISAKRNIKEKEQEKKLAKRASREAGTMQEILNYETRLKQLQKDLDKAEEEYKRESEEIENQYDELLKDIRRKIGKEFKEEQLFTIRFRIQ